jgi:hypothetical protein
MHNCVAVCNNWRVGRLMQHASIMCIGVTFTAHRFEGSIAGYKASNCGIIGDH